MLWLVCITAAIVEVSLLCRLRVRPNYKSKGVAYSLSIAMCAALLATLSVFAEGSVLKEAAFLSISAALIFLLFLFDFALICELLMFILLCLGVITREQYLREMASAVKLVQAHFWILFCIRANLILLIAVWLLTAIVLLKVEFDLRQKIEGRNVNSAVTLRASII